MLHTLPDDALVSPPGGYAKAEHSYQRQALETRLGYRITTASPPSYNRTPQQFTTKTMRLNCFRPSAGRSSIADPLDDPAEKPRPANSGQRPAKRRSRTARRHGSADSRGSMASNDSISKLAPCKGVSCPLVEAMMMPVPTEHCRESKCLRLSQPRTYGNIVASMKEEKGCRDWRNFAVFYDDDVDMTRSAVEEAKKRAAEYQRRLRMLDSFDEEDSSRRQSSAGGDMIG